MIDIKIIFFNSVKLLSIYISKASHICAMDLHSKKVFEYLLKRCGKLRFADRSDKCLKGDPIFEKLFNIAQVSNLTSAEMNAYLQSLKIKRDNYNHDQYVLNQGIEQGEAKGEYNKSLEIASPCLLR